MNELKDLKVEEVSLVDEGANPEADIVLAKRKDDDAAQALIERLTKRLADMERQLEEDELRKVAAKYSLLGEEPVELAKSLKQAKTAGIYDQTIKLLDTTLALVEKSGTFKELGKSGNRDGSVEETAASLQKRNPQLSRREALDLAWQKIGATG